jgi:hypothetical protein
VAAQDGGLYARTPWSPPTVEMTGGVIGHLLCWERHERDGTWYAWALHVSDDFINTALRRVLAPAFGAGRGGEAAHGPGREDRG